MRIKEQPELDSSFSSIKQEFNHREIVSLQAYDCELKDRIVAYKAVLEGVRTANSQKQRLVLRERLGEDQARLRAQEYGKEPSFTDHQCRSQTRNSSDRQFFLTSVSMAHAPERPKSVANLARAEASEARQIRAEQAKQQHLEQEFVLQQVEKEYLQRQMKNLEQGIQQLKQSIFQLDLRLKSITAQERTVHETCMTVKADQEYAAYNQHQAEKQLRDLRAKYHEQRSYIQSKNAETNKQKTQLQNNYKAGKKELNDVREQLQRKALELESLQSEAARIARNKIGQTELSLYLALFHALQNIYRAKRKRKTDTELSLRDNPLHTFSELKGKLEDKWTRGKFSSTVMIEEYLANHKYGFKELSEKITQYHNNLLLSIKNQEENFISLISEKNVRLAELDRLEAEGAGQAERSRNLLLLEETTRDRRSRLKARTLARQRLNEVLSNLEFAEVGVADLLIKVVRMIELTLSQEFKKLDEDELAIANLIKEIRNEKYFRRFNRKRKKELDEFDIDVFLSVFSESKEARLYAEKFRVAFQAERAIRIFISGDKLKKYLQKIKEKFGNDPRKALDFLDRLKLIAVKVEKETDLIIFSSLERIARLISDYNSTRTTGQALLDSPSNNVVSLCYLKGLHQLNEEKEDVKYVAEPVLEHDAKNPQAKYRNILDSKEMLRPLWLPKKKSKDFRVMSSERMKPEDCYKLGEIIRRVNFCKSSKARGRPPADYLTGVLGIKYEPIVLIPQQASE